MGHERSWPTTTTKEIAMPIDTFSPITPATYAAQKLRQLIKPDTLIHTRTDFGRGEKDYIKVYIITNEPDGRPTITDISWYVAQAAHMRYGKLGISMGGMQYHKGLEVAEACWRATFDSLIPFDQTNNWREIH